MKDSSITPLFSLRFTIVLGLVLFLPFFLRFLSPALEPYPAILLPSGARTINLKKETIEVRLLLLYGYDSQGNLQTINSRKLLSPIPVAYLNGIAREEFGLSTKKNDKINVRFLDDRLTVPKKTISKEAQEQARLWLMRKLRKLGFLDSHLVIRYIVRDLDIKDGREVAERIRNEKIIELR